MQSYNGVSIRVVQDYDITKKRTIISLDVLYGTKTIDADQAVLLRVRTRHELRLHLPGAGRAGSSARRSRSTTWRASPAGYVPREPDEDKPAPSGAPRRG